MNHHIRHIQISASTFDFQTMAPTKDPEATTAVDDPLEKAEAKKESGQAAQEGLKGEAELDEAIADAGGDDIDPEATSAADDSLEKAEAAKESG
ncbi:hypothetical protein N8I77_009703 [Diaporthe amygdali]|uniref:Uncharacterized protein n=1 Tax=Phomopsis amygdali TaxID=1214568 RepID=A0AAD9W3F7_PHOAM|nr:hypothetical protein N8I77_009703 [Diaporthe amygdali]